jgi:hypothetical protein
MTRYINSDVNLVFKSLASPACKGSQTEKMPPTLDRLGEDKEPVAGGSTSTEEQVVSRPASAQEYGQLDTEKQEPGIHEEAENDRNPLSRAVTTDSVIPPPPDGGLHAWLKVFGGFFIYVNIWCTSPPTSLP